MTTITEPGGFPQRPAPAGPAAAGPAAPADARPARASRASGPLIVAIVAGIGFLVTGAYVLWQLSTYGHAAFNMTSVGVVWGLPIIVYDYFLLTSTGLAFIASLSLVFGIQSFRPVAERCLWLAFAGLLGGVSVLFLELGYPIRALIQAPLNLQFASPLFWKILLVGAYSLVLVLTLWRISTSPTRTATPGVPLLATLLVILALLITLVAGSVYGMMAMRPFWFGGEIPVVFLIESFMGGLAFTIFFVHLAHAYRGAPLDTATRGLFAGPLGIAFAISIGLHFLFHAGRAVTGVWSNAEGMQVWQYITSGPLFHIALWGGVALPLVLMALPTLRRIPAVQVVAALLVMASLFVARYEFIIGGQMAPLFKGSWQQGLIAYAPSTTEWMLLAMAVFLANAIFALSEWAFGER